MGFSVEYQAGLRIYYCLVFAKRYDARCFSTPRYGTFWFSTPPLTRSKHTLKLISRMPLASVAVDAALASRGLYRFRGMWCLFLIDS